MITPADITIVIPTYGREQVLVDSICALTLMEVLAYEILLIDQTPDHDEATWLALNSWVNDGTVRRVTFAPPSIPHAMNQGLLKAETEYVLYLDDDIIPDPYLISALVDVLNDIDSPPDCIAGQVIQPGEAVIRYEEWGQSWFPFNSDKRRDIDDVMAGNLCVNRQFALSIKGFDENFKGSAYRFESDFARRVIRCGGKIIFEPKASIRHLRAERGGTRSYGNHLTTWRPHHAVGKYYYAFRGGWLDSVTTLLIQPLRAIRTKHHLKSPWWIPVSLVAESLGILWAFILICRGPRLLSVTPKNSS